MPRPPILMEPKRAKGTEKVAMLGVTLRITMTSAGFQGMSLDDMMARDAAWVEDMDRVCWRWV